MTRVALLGLGIMGGGMAANLLKQGFALTVYNRTREKAEPLAQLGAQIADTPREAAQDADVIVSMVGDDAASRAVWQGEDGALTGLKSGAVLVECSTLTPEWIVELAGLASQAGGKFLDAPVLGSKGSAANGELTLLVGGDAETLESVRPVLEAISSRIAHLGVVGSGATYKLINNMMAAVHIAALAEGLALAERAGLDIEKIAPLITTGAVNSNIVKGKLPRMMEHRYEDTEFALKWMQKDVRYALELGAGFDASLKTVQAALEVVQSALDKGYGEADFAATVEGVRK